jgi:uncharacterized protein YmfQ (DUF2313 family)
MPAIRPSQDDLLTGLLRLMPRGAVWPREQTSTQVLFLAALMLSWQRLFNSDNAMLIDSFPATSVQMLSDWESALGLPDPCAPSNQTIAARQSAVVGRLVFSGGQSVAFYTSYAAQLGYSVTIQQYAPSRFGRPFGRPFGGTDWAFAWTVSGLAVAAPLQCALGRFAPAHTQVNFIFEG